MVPGEGPVSDETRLAAPSLDSVGDPVPQRVAVDLGYHWGKRYKMSPTTAKHVVLRVGNDWYSACSIAATNRHDGFQKATRELKSWLHLATCYACTLPVVERAREIVAEMESEQVAS